MFALSATPLDPAALRTTVRNVRAGGFAAFEGWVRNHNEGRTVERLEYEAYEVVCLAEGRAIIAEAIERFGLLEARCVHRVGELDLEDMAVWVGVSAAHRGEAFDACRYIIDSVKHRLPIWKKEHYTDGCSGWVNCERCAHAGIVLETAPKSLTESRYYARQIQLRDVGSEGQQRLREARVLVVGAGGLGSPALQYLASAGIGTIGIAEADLLEASNLHRQVLYEAAGVGRPKADQAAQRLRAQNPFIDVHVHPGRLDETTIDEIAPQYDVLVDGTDNFETKFLLNDAAVLYGKLLVQASIYQYEGQLFVYDPAGGGPCFRCLWPEMPDPGCVGSCAEVGVLGAVPGVLGAIQAMEVLKHVLRLPGRLQGETFFLDLLSLRSHKVRADRIADCPVCGPRAAKTRIAPDTPIEIGVEDLGSVLAGYTLIDIRETDEAAVPLPGNALRLPASQIRIEALAQAQNGPWVFCCARGMRSRYLAMALRKAGHHAVYSLRGGASALLPRNADCHDHDHF